MAVKKASILPDKVRLIAKRVTFVVIAAMALAIVLQNEWIYFSGLAILVPCLMVLLEPWLTPIMYRLDEHHRRDDARRAQRRAAAAARE